MKWNMLQSFLPASCSIQFSSIYNNLIAILSIEYEKQKYVR